jgi:hypothetical protein
MRTHKATRLMGALVLGAATGNVGAEAGADAGAGLSLAKGNAEVACKKRNHISIKARK